MKYLADIVEIIKGNKATRVFNEPQIGTRRYLQIEDLRPGSTTKYAYDDSGVLATRNDVLIAWDGANAGTVGFELEGYAGSTIAVLKPKSSDLYGPFLGYFLQSQFQYLQDNSTGATIPHISRGSLEKLQLHLPNLTEQKRIVTILQQADRLRQQRRYALELSDTYLQTVFLEMFGDPVRNPKGWGIRSLISISQKFSDGPFGSNLKTEHYTNFGVRVIRLQNIGIGRLLDEDKAFISESHFAIIDKHRCLPGDIIVGTLGDPNLRACILPDSIPVALNKADCVQIRVNPNDAVAEYVCWLLNMPHTLFMATGMLHGQTRVRINMGRLAELQVPIPPLPLQQKFAQVVQRYERLRAQQREAERQVERLFQTLLHRAFQGELKLEVAMADMPEEQTYDTNAPDLLYTLTAPAKLVAEETAQLVLPIE